MPAPVPRLSTHCRYVRLADRTIILDLRRGDYITLGMDQSDRWHRLAQGEPIRDPADASLLEQACGNDYFGVHDSIGSPKPATVIRPAILSALWTILDTRRRLWRRGFPSLYAQCAALTLAQPARDGTLSGVLHAFLRAETMLLHRSAEPQDCLPRSLALFQFLVSRGIKATHRIGVCAPPFEAHAWVEVDGAPLLDRPYYVDRFQPIATLPT